MAVTYRIDTEDRIVYLKTESTSNFPEWREVMLSVLSDPSFGADFDFLSDRGAQTDVPDAEFTRAAAQFLMQHPETFEGRRWATVSSDPAVFGMQRMFGALAEATGITVMAFKNADEARAWLVSTRRGV